jgi:hypothetical protein
MNDSRDLVVMIIGGLAALSLFGPVIVYGMILPIIEALREKPRDRNKADESKND